VPNSIGKIGWQIWVTHHGSWICLRVDGTTQDEATHYYQQLAKQRDGIEAEFGGGLTWDPLEAYRASLIRWDNPRPGGFRDDPDAWPAVGDDLADAMSRLIRATQTRVTALLPFKVVAPSDETDRSAVPFDEIDGG
jgi:hypothetical protein